MSLNLPHPLELRKSYILVIVIIFGSALFISSGSIIYSLENINENLYGSGENTLVISNPQSNTPFTSNVAESLESSILQIEGTIAVSPEIIVPIIFEDQTFILRGVDFGSYNLTSKVTIISGDLTFFQDKVNVFIDQDLNKRL